MGALGRFGPGRDSQTQRNGEGMHSQQGEIVSNKVPVALKVYRVFSALSVGLPVIRIAQRTPFTVFVQQTLSL